MTEDCESRTVGGIEDVPSPTAAEVLPAVADDFEQLVGRFEGPLLRYARQLVGSGGDESQDIVQEAFLRLHRYRATDRARDIRHLSTWLYRVTHNLAMDVLRKRTRRRRHEARLKHAAQAAFGGASARVTGGISRVGGDADPGEALMDLERRELAEYAMRHVRALSGEQREVLVLKLVEGLSIRQIAKVTDSTPGRVAYRLNKAMNELVQRLKDNGAI